MNPDLQAQAEVVAKSYIPETAVGTVTDPKEKAQIEDAKRVRAIFIANPDKPLAALLASEEISDLSEIDVDTEVERRIAAPAPGEDDRRGKAKKAAHEAQAIAEKGLDGIADAGRRDEIVQEYIAKVIDIRGEAFRSLPDDQKKAIAISELSRHEVRIKVAELLRRSLSPTAEIEAEDEKTLAIKMQEKGQKNAEKTQLEEDIVRIDEAITTLREELVAYQPANAATGTPEGEQFRLTEEVRRKINSGRAAELTKELMVLYSRDKEALAQVKIDVRQRVKDGGETLTDETEIKVDELARLEEAQREYKQRQERRDGLDPEIRRLNTERQAREKRIQAIALETVILDLDINPLAQKKKIREQAVLTGISRIVTQACNSALNEDAKKRNDIYRGMLTNKAKETEDNDETTLYDAVGSRWEVMRIIDGQKTLVTNTVFLNADWRFAIESGGDVSPQIEILLTDQIKKSITNTTPPEERARILDEAARIHERLKTDPVFAEKVKSEYLTQLISRRLSTGEPIPVAEQTILQKYGWIEHIAKAVEERIKADTTLKTRLEQITQSAGFDQAKLEEFRKKYPSELALLFALLLAGIAVPSDTSGGKHWYDKLRR